MDWRSHCPPPQFNQFNPFAGYRSSEHFTMQIHCMKWNNQQGSCPPHINTLDLNLSQKEWNTLIPRHALSAFVCVSVRV